MQFLWWSLVWLGRDANLRPTVWEADRLTTKPTRHGHTEKRTCLSDYVWSKITIQSQYLTDDILGNCLHDIEVWTEADIFIVLKSGPSVITLLLFHWILLLNVFVREQQFRSCKNLLSNPIDYNLSIKYIIITILVWKCTQIPKTNTWFYKNNELILFLQWSLIYRLLTC